MAMVVDECCRFCGKSESFKVYLYGPYCEKRCISEKVSYCLSLNISDRDPYSQYICYKCLTDVENFYNFRLMANKIHTSHRYKSETISKVASIYPRFTSSEINDRRETTLDEFESLSDGKDDEDENFDFLLLQKHGKDTTREKENGFTRLSTNHGADYTINKNAATTVSSKSQSNSFFSSLARSGKSTGNEKPLENVNLNLDGRKQKSEETRMQFKNIFQSIVGEEDLLFTRNRKKDEKEIVQSLRQTNKNKPKIADSHFGKMVNGNQLSADLFDSQTPDRKSQKKSSIFGTGDSLMDDISILTFSDWQLTEDDNNIPKKARRLTDRAIH